MPELTALQHFGEPHDLDPDRPAKPSSSNPMPDLLTKKDTERVLEIPYGVPPEHAQAIFENIIGQQCQDTIRQSDKLSGLNLSNLKTSWADLCAATGLKTYSHYREVVNEAIMVGLKNLSPEKRNIAEDALEFHGLVNEFIGVWQSDLNRRWVNGVLSSAFRRVLGAFLPENDPAPSKEGPQDHGRPCGGEEVGQVSDTKS